MTSTCATRAARIAEAATAAAMRTRVEPQNRTCDDTCDGHDGAAGDRAAGSPADVDETVFVMVHQWPPPHAAHEAEDGGIGSMPSVSAATTVSVNPLPRVGERTANFTFL